MKTVIQTMIILAAGILCLPLMAEEVRQITWKDLVPAHLADIDPVAHLTPEQQDLVGWIMYMLETLPPRTADTEDLYESLDQEMPLLKKYNIDLKQIMERTREIQTAVVKELDGQDVRMPGYLLPLEITDGKVTEFLLVPYVGACIHVPPPPPNQIVHVKLDPEDGLKSGNLFDPVWVTGKIKAKSMVKDLFLIDGSANIDIGYTMQADRVEPYKQ
jgi:hypothetical protein